MVMVVITSEVHLFLHEYNKSAALSGPLWPLHSSGSVNWLAPTQRTTVCPLI